VKWYGAEVQLMTEECLESDRSDVRRRSLELGKEWEGVYFISEADSLATALRKVPHRLHFSVYDSVNVVCLSKFPPPVYLALKQNIAR
jgi:hypothetical protein